MGENKTQRKTNLDFLRCVSMLFIIVIHLSFNGVGWSAVTEKYRENMLLYNVGTFFEIVGVIGVNLFFLLSGYFQIHFKWRRFWDIILTLYIYWFIIQFIGLAVGYNTFDKKFILLLLLPLKEYWFLLVYIVLMLLSPLLNSIVEHMDKAKAKWGFIVGFAVFCILCVLNDSDYIGVNRGYSLVFACYLYLIGACISKGLLFSKVKKSSVCFIIWGICALTTIGLMICGFLFGISSILIIGMYNSPLILLASVFFFLGFERAKERPVFGKLGKAARNTMGVYIIHSSNKFVPYYRNIPLQILAGIGTGIWAYVAIIPYAVLIFVVCASIDIVFQKTIGVVIGAISIKLEKVSIYICEKIGCLLA